MEAGRRFPRRLSPFSGEKYPETAGHEGWGSQQPSQRYAGPRSTGALRSYHTNNSNSNGNSKQSGTPGDDRGASQRRQSEVLAGLLSRDHFNHLFRGQHPYVSVFRFFMMLLTVTCILAVDFPIFPRRFAKTEEYGFSLMDVGVGLMIFSAGFLAKNTITHRRHHHQQGHGSGDSYATNPMVTASRQSERSLPSSTKHTAPQKSAGTGHSPFTAPLHGSRVLPTPHGIPDILPHYPNAPGMRSSGALQPPNMHEQHRHSQMSSGMTGDAGSTPAPVLQRSPLVVHAPEAMSHAQLSPEDHPTGDAARDPSSSPRRSLRYAPALWEAVKQVAYWAPTRALELLMRSPVVTHVTSHVRTVAAGSAGPLLLLGLARLIAVKAASYHEHVSEYGVHWNFFFTLASLFVAHGFVTPTAFLSPASIPLAWLTILTAYQVLLDTYGVADYILSTPRDAASLFSMNREGLVSLVGAFTLFELSNFLGDRVIRQKNAPLPLLLPAAALSWAAFLFCTSAGMKPSRRMINAPYVFMILAVSLSLLVLFIVVFMVFRISKESTLVNRLNAVSLEWFLIANVLTGLLNLSFETHSLSDRWAYPLLTAYVALSMVLALLLKKKTLKAAIRSMVASTKLP